MDAATLWGLVASIVSVVLGVIAFWVSLYFFAQAKRTEQAVSNSLTKIETQADMLQKISGRQLDRLTRFVTDPAARGPDPQLESLIGVLVQVVQPLASGRLNDPGQQTAEQLRDELVSCYLLIHHYTAQTNLWSQLQLPSATTFNPEDATHSLVRRTIDGSAADFEYMERLLAGIDAAKVKSNSLAHVYEETAGLRTYIKTSSDLFVAKAQEQSG
jgi:hypothetical protein